MDTLGFGQGSRVSGRRIGSLAVLACVATLLVLAGSAQATFPGKNGKIAFVSNQDDPEPPFYGDSDIYTINPDGTAQARLTDAPGQDERPSWSPDGKRIVFQSTRDAADPSTCDFGPVSGPPCNWEIYVMNADGTGETRITNNSARDANPAWSPDGSKIVFDTNRNPNANRLDRDFFDIFVMNSDGTGEEPLTGASSIGEFAPSWSPDGRKIAFSRDRAQGTPGGGIWTMDADGTDQTQVTNPLNTDGADALPDWSPDGEQIVFTRELPCGFFVSCNDVMLVNSDGTGMSAVTTPRGNSSTDRAGAWSPDGSKIVFERHPGIYTINPDGTQATLVSDSPRDDLLPDWQPLPGPQRSDYKNAASFCKAERDFLGEGAFRNRYGGGANAYGKCVSGR